MHRDSPRAAGYSAFTSQRWTEKWVPANPMLDSTTNSKPGNSWPKLQKQITPYWSKCWARDWNQARALQGNSCKWLNHLCRTGLLTEAVRGPRDVRFYPVELIFPSEKIKVGHHREADQKVWGKFLSVWHVLWARLCRQELGPGSQGLRKENSTRGWEGANTQVIFSRCLLTTHLF